MLSNSFPIYRRRMGNVMDRETSMSRSYKRFYYLQFDERGSCYTYPGKQGKHKNEIIQDIQNSMITETRDLEFLGDNVKDTTVTIRSWEFPGHVKVHNALRLFIFASLYPHVRACAPPFSPLKRRFFLDCIISSTRLSERAPSWIAASRWIRPLHVGKLRNVTVPPFEICHQENFKSRM